MRLGGDPRRSPERARPIGDGGRCSKRSQLHHLDAADGLVHLDRHLAQRVAAQKAKLQDLAVAGREAVEDVSDPGCGIFRRHELPASRIVADILGEL
jgi:hypothetical protein